MLCASPDLASGPGTDEDEDIGAEGDPEGRGRHQNQRAGPATATHAARAGRTARVQSPLALPTHPQHGWGKIIALKSLTIPDAIARFVQEHGSDGSRFLQDMPLQKLSGGNDTSASHALATRYNYSIQLTNRNDTMDPARAQFLYIMWRDVVVMLNPQSSLRHLSDPTREELEDLVDSITYGRRSITHNSTLENVDAWVRFGVKALHIGQTFGLGALLILAPKLSHDLYVISCWYY